MARSSPVISGTADWVIAVVVMTSTVGAPAVGTRTERHLPLSSVISCRSAPPTGHGDGRDQMTCEFASCHELVVCLRSHAWYGRSTSRSANGSNMRSRADGSRSATRLPTERELMEQFAASRNPVQTAMSKLVETGLVQRRRGSGTIVASTGLRSSLLRVLHASTDGPGKSRVPTASSATRVIAAESHPLSADLFTAGTPVAEIVRIKLDSTGTGIAVERCLVDLTFAPDILNQDLAVLTTAAYYSSIGSRSVPRLERPLRRPSVGGRRQQSPGHDHPRRPTGADAPHRQRPADRATRDALPPHATHPGGHPD